jgi:hypothetical protein
MPMEYQEVQVQVQVQVQVLGRECQLMQGQ